MTTQPDLRLRRLVAGILAGPGALDRETRLRALNLEPLPPPLGAFVQKLEQAERLTGDDVVVLRDAGFSQDQVIELTMCAALGVARSRMRAGLTALEEATAW